jgi:hypothetical protein
MLWHASVGMNEGMGDFSFFFFSIKIQGNLSNAERERETEGSTNAFVQQKKMQP